MILKTIVAVVIDVFTDTYQVMFTCQLLKKVFNFWNHRTHMLDMLVMWHVLLKQTFVASTPGGFIWKVVTIATLAFEAVFVTPEIWETLVKVKEEPWICTQKFTHFLSLPKHLETPLNCYNWPNDFLWGDICNCQNIFKLENDLDLLPHRNLYALILMTYIPISCQKSSIISMSLLLFQWNLMF